MCTVEWSRVNICLRSTGRRPDESHNQNKFFCVPFTLKTTFSAYSALVQCSQWGSKLRCSLKPWSDVSLSSHDLAWHCMEYLRSVMTDYSIDLRCFRWAEVCWTLQKERCAFKQRWQLKDKATNNQLIKSQAVYTWAHLSVRCNATVSGPNLKKS